MFCPEAWRYPLKLGSASGSKKVKLEFLSLISITKTSDLELYTASHNAGYPEGLKIVNFY
jgi:hypothetical protein